MEGRLVGALGAALAATILLAIGLGPIAIAPGTTLAVIAGELSGFGRDVDPATAYIVWELRVPRVATGAIVGAGLACAGAVVQAFLRNPVADPFVLGLSSGASAAAVIAMVTGLAILGTFTLPLVAFAGAMVTLVAVFALARERGRLVPVRLLLVGVALAQLLAGVTSFALLQTRSIDAQQQVLFWLLGSLGGARWALLPVPAAIVAAAVAFLVWRSVRLDVLAQGDEPAAALGLDASRLRVEMLILTSLLTGATVAVAGAIGFIGLVVPHIARLLVGASHRRLIPVAALLGAIVLVWADTAARLVLAPEELPIGILTAALGVPFFIVLLRRRGRELGASP